MIFITSSGGGFMRFMTDLGVTVCVVMVASLLVALTVVPMVAAFLLSGETGRRAPLVEWMGRFYGRVIALHPPPPAGLPPLDPAHAVGLLVALLGDRAELLLRLDRAPGDDQRRHPPQLLARADGRRCSTRCGACSRRSARSWRSRTSSTGTTAASGRSRGRLGRGPPLRDLPQGRGRVAPLDPRDPGRDPADAPGEGRGGLPHRPVPGARSASPGSASRCAGTTWPSSSSWRRRWRTRSTALPWVKDVDTSLDSGDEEIHVRPRRARALQSGLSSEAVAATVSSALTSRPVSRIKTDEREVDLVVQFREEDRRTLGQLKTLPVAAAAGRQPIGALADFSIESGPQTIERENRRPELDVAGQHHPARRQLPDDGRGAGDPRLAPPAAGLRGRVRPLDAERRPGPRGRAVRHPARRSSSST